MWTIFDGQGRAVANCDAQPHFDDLALRGERAVYHQENIPLEEVILDGDVAKRKAVIELAVSVNGLSATVTASCRDTGVSEIPLLIGETKFVRPPGTFIVNGEPGVSLLIDFERDFFQGNCLEVIFDG